jgi:hypothetical protein
MLSLKTTIGLIAALAVVATASVASAFTPQAFAQVSQFAQNNAQGNFNDQSICQNAAQNNGFGNTANANQGNGVGNCD